MVIITEDIIRKALNESIDEFMINEDALNEKWGDAFKSAWNGIKNFAAEYMDKKTNGQWNKKYGIQAKGSGTNVGTYYLEKWLNPRYSRLYDIVYGNYYGDRTYFYTQLNGRNLSFSHDWRTGSYALTDNYSGLVYRLKINENNIPSILTIENFDGNKIAESTNTTYNRHDGSYDFAFQNNANNSMKIYTGEDNTTPEAYIAKNCTPNSFVNGTQNTLENGDIKTAIINYIQAIQNVNNKNIEKLRNDPNERIDYNYMLKLFTMEGFYNWYRKNSGQRQNNNQQQRSQPQPQPQQQSNNNQGQQQRNAANNSAQGASSYYANVTDNKKPRMAF
jgi:hypothetical protein